MRYVPEIEGIIDRRILINFRVDKNVLENYLPYPFKPKTVKGKGVAGICLIRLKNIRPKGFPAFLGISSENGAHRIAVEWNENGKTKEGVFIPRRDTSSRINAFAGGRLFPGTHHLSNYSVKESDGKYFVKFENKDGTYLQIEAKKSINFSTNSIFDKLEEASEFFERGSLGYTPNKEEKCFDGIELNIHNWEVTPMEVQSVKSSFFEDNTTFPEGSYEFDNALLMEGIKHEWKKSHIKNWI